MFVHLSIIFENFCKKIIPVTKRSSISTLSISPWENDENKDDDISTGLYKRWLACVIHFFRLLDPG